MYHTRLCRTCSSTIFHNNESSLKKALKKNGVCRPCSKKKAIDPTATEKFCPRCKNTLPYSEFSVDSKRPDGRQSACKNCANSYARLIYYPNNKEQCKAKTKRYLAGIREKIKDLKRVPCADCMITYDPVCMDFDHLPGHKKVLNISNLWREYGSWKKIEEELPKCEVVCANCHRLRTKRRHEESTP